MQTQLTGYFCVYNRVTRKLVGMDLASGGYPFDTADFRNAKLSTDRFEMEEWASKFDSYPGFDLVVKPISISIGGL